MCAQLFANPLRRFGHKQIAQLCARHLTHTLPLSYILFQIDRNYLQKVLGQIDDKELYDDMFVNEVKMWLYSFKNDIETEEEEKHSLSKLREVIAYERSAGRVTSSILDYTENFLTAKFEDRLRFICFRHYMYSRGGQVADNCYVESENAATAKDPTGPKPKYGLAVSASALIQHTDNRMKDIIANCHE